MSRGDVIFTHTSPKQSETKLFIQIPSTFWLNSLNINERVKIRTRPDVLSNQSLGQLINKTYNQMYLVYVMNQGMLKSIMYFTYVRLRRKSWITLHTPDRILSSPAVTQHNQTVCYALPEIPFIMMTQRWLTLMTYSLIELGKEFCWKQFTRIFMWSFDTMKRI